VDEEEEERERWWWCKGRVGRSPEDEDNRVASSSPSCSPSKDDALDCSNEARIASRVMVPVRSQSRSVYVQVRICLSLLLSSPARCWIAHVLIFPDGGSGAWEEGLGSREPRLGASAARHAKAQACARTSFGLSRPSATD
jgi:hypothetical protein